MRHNDAMSDDADLAARLADLEAEKARLRAASVVAAEPPEAASPGGRWRAVVSAVCIVIAAVLVPVSIVAAWARVQLVDEDAFVATLSPLAADPAVQSMIVDETMSAITAKVDFAALTSDVIDGVAGLDLPPAAVSALQLLKQPAAEGLENIVDGAVTRVVTSDAFADVWTTATRASHRALTAAATSDGGGLVVRTEDGVGIQLGAIVAQVTQNLSDRGVGVAGLIPAVDRVVILGSGENLVLVRTGYAVAGAVGYWLPLATLALFAVGILVARRRSTAFLGSGIALFVGAGSLAVGVAIGSAAMATVAGSIDLSPAGLGVVYAQLSAQMAHTAAVLAVVGAVVAALAWTRGGSRAARSLRGGVGSINSGLRRGLAHRGAATGAFGAWLYRRPSFTW